MGKSSSSAPAADPNIGNAQNKMADLANQQWSKFTTDIYPEMLRQSQVQENRANEQWAMDKTIAQTNLDRSNQAYQRYEEGAIPAMEKLKADADQYNEENYREQLAQGAKADIGTAMGVQRRNEEMRQRAYGIDPTSGASISSGQSMGVNQALMEAQAMNQTRQAAKDIGLQKQANVYNMYAGLPAQANANTGITLNANQAGLSAGQTAIGNFAATGSALNAGASTALSGWNNVGNLGVGATNAATNAWGMQQQANATSSAGLGNMVGTLGAAYMTGGASLAAGGVK